VTGLILAAGAGKRLAPLTDERPKGLIEVGGRCLLARLLDGLQGAGVRATALVVGYKHEMIRAALGTSHRGMPLRYLVNPAFERGPRLSLWTGRDELQADDVLLADGDVLFAPALLNAVVRHPAPHVFLGEPDFDDTGEEINLYVRGPRVVAIRRGVAGPPATPWDTRAEWVGFARIGRVAGQDLAGVLDAMVREDRVEGDYEAALDALLPRHPFVTCPTGALPWVEIDTPQDLEVAEREVLPRLIRAGV
jgi:choline kinase